MIKPNEVPGVRRVRHRLRTRFAEHPAAYLPFARHKYPGPSPRVIDRSTELVLDGYTRSASTFAVYALQLAQPRPLRLAHHLHAPAQLVAGVRAGLPTLLVVRAPRGAVLSQVVREPGVAIRDALEAYARFHERLRPYRGAMMVADFAAVTGDFGSVIRALNAKFGLTLTEFVHCPEAVAECYQLIALRSLLDPRLLGFESGLVSRAVARETAARLAAPTATERELWVPSATRELAKEELGAQWERRSLAGLRSRAEDVYQEFLAGAVVRTTPPVSANAGELS